MSLKLISVLFKIIDWVTFPYFWYKSIKQKKAIPQTKNHLVNISATQLSRKIRKKEISCYEVVLFYISRIKQVNPIVNAIVDERFSQALEDAKAVDEFLQCTQLSETELENVKPLLGVPVTLKESCCLAGCSLAVGSLTRLDTKASEDGEAVARLKAAGAIPLAVTNTPEFCVALETVNLVTGTTNNPYDTNRSSGGSSGGEAALISAGASIAGIGSDLAGSVRIPAGFCGIFGYKPTSCIVSIKGHFPQSVDPIFHQSLTIGPLTRYAEDLKLMAHVIGGDEIQKLHLYEKIDLSGIKLYYVYEFTKKTMLPPVQEDIKEAIMQCVHHLTNHCKSELINDSLDDLSESVEIVTAQLLRISLEGCPNLLEDPKNPKIERNVYVEIIKNLLGQSNISIQALSFYVMQKTQLYITEKQRAHYLLKADSLRKTLKTTLSDGVLIFPTFSSTAFLSGQSMIKLFGTAYAALFNALGFPAVNVPLGLNKDRLPIGISVVSAPNNDKYCLAVAEELERKFGGWVPPY